VSIARQYIDAVFLDQPFGPSPRISAESSRNRRSCDLHDNPDIRKFEDCRIVCFDPGQSLRVGKNGVISCVDQLFAEGNQAGRSDVMGWLEQEIATFGETGETCLIKSHLHVRLQMKIATTYQPEIDATSGKQTGQSSHALQEILHRRVVSARHEMWCAGHYSRAVSGCDASHLQCHFIVQGTVINPGENMAVQVNHRLLQGRSDFHLFGKALTAIVFQPRSIFPYHADRPRKIVAGLDATRRSHALPGMPDFNDHVSWQIDNLGETASFLGKPESIRTWQIFV
jgi:hypothetical protein